MDEDKRKEILDALCDFVVRVSKDMREEELTKKQQQQKKLRFFHKLLRHY